MNKFEYCLFFIGIALAGSINAQAVTLDANGILRNDDGTIRYMNLDEALQSCPRGTHLPTVRELARDAQSRGAKGILETSQVNPNQVSPFVIKVSAVDPNGRLDEFYYDYRGYQRPMGDLGNNNFWSSSSVARPIQFNSGYVLSHWRAVGHAPDYPRENGGIYEAYRIYKGYAVRCFQNRQ